MTASNQPICLEEILREKPIVSSAPCRVDCGGTWDLRTFWLPYQHITPVTVNIAIDLRTQVNLLPLRRGWTKVTSTGFDAEEYPSDEAPFDTPLGLAFAAAAYFNTTGLHIDITSDSPPRSGLGGSGVLGVALFHAFSKALHKTGQRLVSRESLVRLAYQLEDSLSVSLTGMQDQAAAAYGGINQWWWGRNRGFEREVLVPAEKIPELNNNILIAYCGEAHNSAEINKMWVKSFLEGRNRRIWFAINELTKQFGLALRCRDLSGAAEAVREEMLLRQTLTKEVLIPASRRLVNAAMEVGCGARFAGAGGGGCVWAIGDCPAIDTLRERWRAILEKTKAGSVLNADLDTRGVT